MKALALVGRGMALGLGMLLVLALVGATGLGVIAARTYLVAQKQATTTETCTPSPCESDAGLLLHLISVQWRLKVKDTSDYLHPKEVETDGAIGVQLQFENDGVGSRDVHPSDLRFQDGDGVQRGPSTNSSIIPLGDEMDGVGLARNGHYSGVWLYFANPRRSKGGVLIWRPSGGSEHLLSIGQT